MNRSIEEFKNSRESLYERDELEPEDPYFRISRAMYQDRSISPKAKGVLGYLLSLPHTWKIYHSQLQYALNVGENYINSAMDELVKQGYAHRTRERVKGVFQPYKYKISQFKKFLPKVETPSGEEFKKCSPDGVSRAGSSGPENPGLDIIYSENTHIEKQQQKSSPSAPAAVFSKPKKFEVKKQEIHECLDEIEIPKSEKVWITSKYPKDKVDKVVLCSKTRTDIQCLTAWIKGMLNKNDFEIAPTKQEKYLQNKEYAKSYDNKVSGQVRITTLSKTVEIDTNCSYTFVCLSFDDPAFMKKFQQQLSKYKFPIKEI